MPASPEPSVSSKESRERRQPWRKNLMFLGTPRTLTFSPTAPRAPSLVIRSPRCSSLRGEKNSKSPTVPSPSRESFSARFGPMPSSTVRGRRRGSTSDVVRADPTARLPLEDGAEDRRREFV